MCKRQKVLLRCGLIFSAVMVLLFVKGCASQPPARQDNLCSIFQEHPKWFKAAAKSERRWGVPIAVQMAFVQRESSFDSRARPPRKKLLGVVPWKPQMALGIPTSVLPVVCLRIETSSLMRLISLAGTTRCHTRNWGSPRATQSNSIWPITRGREATLEAVIVGNHRYNVMLVP